MYDAADRRFMAVDKHWNSGNMIYGDNPNNDNPVPSTVAIMQANDLYAYCINNPLIYNDPSGLYSIDKALQYAAKWWNKINPMFPQYIEDNGLPSNDCANFISQCLNAGGWLMTPNWHYLTLHNYYYYLFACEPFTKIKISHSWGNADGLKEYLKDNRKLSYKEYTNINDFRKAIKEGYVKVGDVIIGCNSSWGGEHAIMIGRTKIEISPINTTGTAYAYYYAHTGFRDANNDGSEIVNIFNFGWYPIVFSVK
jgi:hypothetical protein